MALTSPTARRDGFKFRWDIVLFFSFVFAAMRRSTGLEWHEWLGVVLIPVLLVHFWLNWSWIVDFIGHPLRGLPGEARFNRWWNFAQFAVTVVALGSGLLVSRFVLPSLGLAGLHSNFWGNIHAGSATILTIMLGVHLGLHAHWLWSKIKRTARPTTGPDVRSKSRRWLLILGLCLALIAACLWLRQWDVYRHHRSLIGRFRDDFAYVNAQIAVPGMLTLGLLVFIRRRRR
jgi:hypothetical protein